MRFFKQGNVLVVHQLGHDGLAGHGAGFLQKLQALGPQTLEAVRAGARFKRTAAQNAGPGGLHALRYVGDLLLALDAARAGHYGKVPAADLVPAHIHDGIIGVELAVGFLVRLGHAAAGFHYRVGQHPAFGQRLCVADQTQNVGVAAHRIIDLVAHALQLGAERLDLLGRGMLL